MTSGSAADLWGPRWQHFYFLLHVFDFLTQIEIADGQAGIGVGKNWIAEWQ